MLLASICGFIRFIRLFRLRLMALRVAPSVVKSSPVYKGTSIVFPLLFLWWHRFWLIKFIWPMFYNFSPWNKILFLYYRIIIL